MQKFWLYLLLLVSIALAACGGQSPDQTELADLPVPTSPVIPPTFTPLPPGSQLGTFPVVTVTQAPLPTEVTHTPIPFGANVVEVRLTIPAIGLDRRLQGGVNSQIILVDESSGFWCSVTTRRGTARSSASAARFGAGASARWL